MKHRAKITFAAGVALAALTLAVQPAQAKTKLLFCSFVTPKHVISSGVLKPWVQDIVKATEGRVQIRYVQACRMAPPPLQMVMVQKGTADGAYVFNAFLRKLVPGGANRSYGVEVARLAGVPEIVLARARALLGTLEESGSTTSPGARPAPRRPPAAARRSHASCAS